jgi:hypothetical protein
MGPGQWLGDAFCSLASKICRLMRQHSGVELNAPGQCCMHNPNPAIH